MIKTGLKKQVQILKKSNYWQKLI